jgi:hypothetical protein
MQGFTYIPVKTLQNGTKRFSFFPYFCLVCPVSDKRSVEKGKSFCASRELPTMFVVADCASREKTKHKRLSQKW